jgi:hypothetical protein
MNCKLSIAALQLLFMAKTKEYFRFTRLVCNSWSVRCICSFWTMRLRNSASSSEISAHAACSSLRCSSISALVCCLKSAPCPLLPHQPTPVGSARDIVSHPHYVMRCSGTQQSLNQGASTPTSHTAAATANAS